MQSVNQLYNQLGEGDILQSFEGFFKKSDVDDLLSQAEDQIKNRIDNNKKIRKVFSLYIECLQNLYHHISKDCSDCKQKGTIVLTNKDDVFNILTSNYIDNSQTKIITKQIDSLNSLSQEELKRYYLDNLCNNRYSDKGGGGLGLIDMIRKSKNRLEYKIEKFDDHFSSINLKVKI